jgi:hypothetical protein
VSIRAVPENSLIYRGNPDNDPCRDYGGLGARGSIFKDSKMTLIRGRGAGLSPEDVRSR